MTHVFKFTVSYLAALITIAGFIAAISAAVIGVGSIIYEIKLLAIAVAAIALLALLPAFFATWMESKSDEMLLRLRFALYGTVVGFIESTIVVWIGTNGDLSSGISYILLLTAVGCVGGGTFATVWNWLSGTRFQTER